MDLTELFALIAAWATVLLLTIALINYLEELDQKLNNGIISMLKTFPNMSNFDMIRKSNQIFLQLFDKLYVTNPEKNFYIWFWIFFSTIFTIVVGLKYQFDNIVVPPLDKLLLFSLILPTISVLFMKVVNFWMILKMGYLQLLMYFQAISQGILLFVLISQNEKFCFLIRFFSLEITSNQINSIVVIFFTGSLLLIIFTYFSFDKFSFLVKISPIRAILSSLIAMTIVALFSPFFNEEIAQSFISDFDSIGITILAYIFLNIFADSISLWETSFILRLAATGSMSKFFSMIIFDILISALIFLAIPWSTGNLHVFLEAIKFQGEVPWLGILFWSTFFTSVIFYFFVLSVCLLIIAQRISCYYVRLDGVLPIMDKPIKSLGVVAIVLITIIFMILTIIIS